MNLKDSAKYPILPDASKHLPTEPMTLDTLISEDFEPTLTRSIERINDSVAKGFSSYELKNPETELLSYPVAMLLVTLVNDEFLTRRFAFGEGERFHRIIKKYREADLDLVIEGFGWNVKIGKPDNEGNTVRLMFTHYLDTASHFKDTRWKLVNRYLDNGYVHLTESELIRLMQVHVQKTIQQTLEDQSLGEVKLPEVLAPKLQHVIDILDYYRPKMRGAMPKDVQETAFPPCIQTLIKGAVAGKRLSHVERFALVSFLANVGVGVNPIVKMFSNVTDFNEGKTRYHTRHISGLTGQRIKYKPPSCRSQLTNRTCTGKDNLCNRVGHPLGYYRIKHG